MAYNLSELTQEEKDKINVSLAASGVAFKERYNMPIVAEAIAREQPEYLRTFFQERLLFYRARSQHYSRLPFEPQSKK
ncbi:DNA polymerase III theta subunit [Proteus hauseri ATCC 700826]|uniref:DNA polymerase III theta subunit n=1 Tax=Proteus hauseri ATCC 700826 TaxID=1354271 RepID=A0AAJ3HSJ7_PROHU|nr:DNA polymerase III subunit theta [Proteus hauseri]OAT46438.1 DNA polymerase III theta subunit [Proteus hauseri ATCC 700826]